MLVRSGWGSALTATASVLNGLFVIPGTAHHLGCTRRKRLGGLHLVARASPDLIETKLKEGLERLKIDAETSLPYLLNLVIGGGSADGFGALPASELVGLHTREALRQLIFALCRLGRPVVMVVEDLHWIDSASQGVLDDVVKNATDEPLLLLCSFRPQFHPIWALTGGGAELRLSALTNVIATEIIRERLEGQSLPEELVELGVVKSEGNPLFAEEFASYLSQKGLQRELAGDADFGGAYADLDDIPTSLENLIMDRVHRLGRDTISFLQAASVLGRQFPMGLAQQVADINGKLVLLLPQLELDGLIFRVDRDIGDSSEDYAFKHALVQDALYGSLLTPQKAVLHQKAAEALEELYGDKAPDVADMLAHHYVRTQRAEKAVYYLALAAKKSLRVFSLAEAQAYLDQALVKIAAEPDCASDRLLAEIVVDRLLVCCWEADFIGMREIAEKYRARLEAAGDSRELSRILAWLGEAYLNAARFDEAEHVLDRARAIGEELEDEECIAYAMWDQMWLYMVTPDGRPRDAIDTMAQRVLQAAERLKDPYLETLTYLLLSTDGLQRGHATLAGRWAAKLIELGRRRRYPPAQSLGWVYAASAASYAEDHEKALGRQQTRYRHLARPFREDYGRKCARRGAGRGRAAGRRLEHPRAAQARGHRGELSRAAYDDRDPLRHRHGPVGQLRWRRRRSREYDRAVLEMAQQAHARLGPSRARRGVFVARHCRQIARLEGAAAECELLCARHSGGPTSGAAASRRGGAPCPRGRHARLLAQGLADLGLLGKFAGQPEAARLFFQQARAIAEELGAKKLIGRIDAAL
jgi:hypothetical protein